MIDFGQKEVRHYDSFGRPGSVYVDAAFRFLKDELNRLRSVGVEGLPVNLDEWSRDNRAAMPLQDNGFDCGMFVIVDANFLSHHLALDFTQTWLSFVSASH